METTAVAESAPPGTGGAAPTPGIRLAREATVDRSAARSDAASEDGCR